jgi:S1-C subfamily serine protease
MSMRKYALQVSLLCLVVLFLPLVLFAMDGNRENVVKIYVSKREYNYFNPWQVQGRYSVEGSGAIIKDNYILTSAHLVSNSTFIQVKRTGQTKKYIAKVLFMANESDLAILKVNNSTFYPDSKPFDIGELTSVGDEIEVYGYPNWNEQLTVTKGIVSRVSHEHYVYSNVSLLTCQIDAAINPGNSGGPVVARNKLVGVAMQMGQGENEGYIVPVPVLKHFLQDIEDGSYDGIPELGITYQIMENQDMREYFGMSEDQSGILLRKLHPGSPAQKILKADDVILSIDRTDIANDGTVQFRREERTLFQYVVQQKQVGDVINVELLRNKDVMHKRIPLSLETGKWRLIPFEQHNVEPTYYIFAGFIFIPLTENVLMDFGGWYDAPLNLAYHYFYGEPVDQNEQIIIIIDVLSDEINVGYENFYYEIVIRVNGRNIMKIEDIIESIQSNRETYHVIETEAGEKIILDRKKARASKNRILKTYDIKHDRSKDLR